MSDAPYYRADLALVHHLGFGFHADRCAPGIVRLLEPVRARNGLVVELGCGSGALTRYLVDAGHRVIATDASPSMVDLAHSTLADAADVRQVVLPHDPIPQCDAVVSVGHVLSYLPHSEAVERALVAAAKALRPGGVLAVDLCDLRYGAAPDNQPSFGAVGDEWAIVTRFSRPQPDRFVRDITTFVRDDTGGWRRDDERHENVLVDTARLPAMLSAHGVDAEIRASFGDEELPDGLVAIVGTRQT